MKLRKICVLLAMIMLMMVFVINVVGDWLPPCKNSDDCGKIQGRIIDSDTNEIVKEEFTVSIFPFYKDIKPESREYYSLKTKNGHFSINVKPGAYTMSFTPTSSKTKYPSNYNPYHPPSDDQIIKVEKGKITDITKKVTEGGNLKVILVDANKQKLNFYKYFKKGGVRIYLSNGDIGYDSSISMKKEEIEAGEIIIGNLTPCIYSIYVYFPGAGYGNTKKEFVTIERKKITEYLVVIDPFDSSGIHGFVKDGTGVIIKNVEITIYNYIKGYGFKGFADTCSDENGYYKIIGIDEGIYNLRIETEDFSEFYIYNIKISKNQLLSKDIIVLFSQQFGRDIANLIPTNGGEIGPIVGFREDSSFLKNSVYFTEMHPILSSSTTGILDVGIDGYFSVNSSSTATFLLRREAMGAGELCMGGHMVKS